MNLENSMMMIGVAIAVVFSLFILSFVLKVLRSLRLSTTRRRKPAHKRDAKRVYTEKQKVAAKVMCGGQCEGGIIRCKTMDGVGKHGLHGDHWFPHSRGGMTNEKNLVMLCPKCNRSKSDKIPTFAQTWAIALRRKFAYSQDVPKDIIKPGQWAKIVIIRKRNTNELS